MGSSNNAKGGHMMGNGQMMGNSQMSMGDVKKIEWEDDMNMMNTQSTKDTLKWKLLDKETNKENMDIDWQFQKGDIVKIKLHGYPLNGLKYLSSLKS